MEIRSENHPIRPLRVRRRTDNQGSFPHPRKITIRVTERLSNEVASIQGLVYAFGGREPLSSIFERVLMPVLREYVRPLAERAKELKLKEKEGR